MAKNERPADLAPNAVWPPKAEYRVQDRTVVSGVLQPEEADEIRERVSTLYGPDPDTQDVAPSVQAGARRAGRPSRAAAAAADKAAADKE